jgi:hypothetical protein
MSWYYLSFAGDEGFRGCCIVEAGSIEDAHVESVVRKINPGGEVMLFQLTEKMLSLIRWPARNRLLSMMDMEDLWGDLHKLEPEEISAAVAFGKADLIDEQCNTGKVN